MLTNVKMSNPNTIRDTNKEILIWADCSKFIKANTMETPIENKI